MSPAVPGSDANLLIKQSSTLKAKSLPLRRCDEQDRTPHCGGIKSKCALPVEGNHLQSNNKSRVAGRSPTCKSLIIKAAKALVIETRVRFPSPAPLLIVNDLRQKSSKSNNNSNNNPIFVRGVRRCEKRNAMIDRQRWQEVRQRLGRTARRPLI